MSLIEINSPIVVSLRRLLGSALCAMLFATAGPATAAPCALNDPPKRCSDGVHYMYCVGIDTGTKWDMSECLPSTPQPKGPFPWLIKGSNSVPSVSKITLNNSPGSGWSVAGVADFNGDGQADILWRRSNDTGEARIWILQGQTVTDIEVARTPADGWRILGVGDFNGDGKADILWRRSDGTGEARIWYLNVANVVGDVSIGIPAPNLELVGIGDFDGDGRADIVWGFKQTP